MKDKSNWIYWKNLKATLRHLQIDRTIKKSKFKFPKPLWLKKYKEMRFENNPRSLSNSGF